MTGFTVSIAGDSAINLEFSHEISARTSQRIRCAAQMLKADPVPGIVELVPAFCSLMICYDPTLIDYDSLIATVRGKLRNLSAVNAEVRRIVKIPVRYGGEFGPDLARVAAHADLSENEVVALHSGRDYLIDMLGFLPGFAYLGGLDERLSIPRLEVPRTRIEAGSIGIGGSQTGVYPLASPGGWQIIGRTPVRPYDPDRARPVLYAAGDYLRFVPISMHEYARIEQLVLEREFDHDSLVEELADADGSKAFSIDDGSRDAKNAARATKAADAKEAR